MQKVVNLTPHSVSILNDSNETVTVIASSGNARCKQVDTRHAATVNNIPLSSTSFGKVEGLPEEKKGIYYIVSRLIRTALPSRKDLLVPNEIVRNEKGQIVGCKSLAVN